jgi:predicted AAA+ superfamily ATPase
VSFYPFDQDEYLRIVDVWIAHFDVAGAGTQEAHKAAVQWSLSRGSRSGRVAWQFARDWAGKQRMKR